MKAYLASGFRQRYSLRTLAEMLEEKGIITCSSWIWREKRPDRRDAGWDFFAENIAKRNVLDLSESDILILDTAGIGPSNHGGCHWETGFMLAHGKPVYIVGKRISSFHWLPEIKVADTYAEVVEIIVSDKR